jgi:uncharacterized protein (UPF0212 family)
MAQLITGAELERVQEINADVEAALRTRLEALGGLTLENLLAVVAEAVSGLVYSVKQTNEHHQDHCQEIADVKLGGSLLTQIADEHNERLAEIERELDIVPDDVIDVTFTVTREN